MAADLAATEKACSSARLVAASRAVDCGAHLAAGFRDGAAWLACLGGVSSGQARRDLETAERLESCPQTSEALRSGQISMAQAAEIARAEAETPGVEAALVPVARVADLSRVRDRAREEREAQVGAEDLHARQRRARYFRHWRDRQGMVCFAAAVTPEVGVPFVERLEQAAGRLRRAVRAAAPDAPRERWEAHAADAFVELCAGAAHADSNRPPRAELVVVCDLFAWRRGHAHPGEVCQVIGGGPVPVGLARELAGDPFLKAVLHDGVRIDTVKHFGRHIPAELRTALDLGPVPAFTGRQCSHCGARRGLQYDHIDPVAHDGPTSYDNVQALCWAHHQAKTRDDRQAGLTNPARRAGNTRPPPDDP